MEFITTQKGEKCVLDSCRNTLNRSMDDDLGICNCSIYYTSNSFLQTLLQFNE